MPSAVLRIYDNAPGLIDAVEARPDEVRSLMLGVPGMQTWGLSRTGDTSAVSITVCDDKAGCDESIRVAADWIKGNLTNEITPPTIVEGDAVRFFHKLGEGVPHTRTAVFSEPAAAGLENSEAEIREMLASVPGFRSFTVINNSNGGASITVCDDKAGTDECTRRIRALIQDKFPGNIRTPRVIEGEGVVRVVAETETVAA